jgi:GT2 family glycosyltransferase/glycosyltransferase involved in cell wall biosynthesis
MGRMLAAWLFRARNRLSQVPLARRIYRTVIMAWSSMKRKGHLLLGLVRRKHWERLYIENSGLLDRDWYIAKYGDLLSKHQDPLSHFLSVGSGMGLCPSPLFDTQWYKENNPDVVRTGNNPLAHYLRFGAYEGRSPNPLFDSTWYLNAYPDIRASGLNPLVHYMRYGLAEKRDPCALLSTHWYLSQYEDVANAGLDPLLHYLDVGAYEGRDPNPFFSSAWYLSRYRDVSGSKTNPLVHYMVTGWREGRQPSPQFNGAKYLEIYPDVAAVGIDPLEHYLRSGMHEQRQQPVDFCSVDSLMPTQRSAAIDRSARPAVDVIIPVYRGVEETKRCIESVYEARCRTSMRVLVINDCSPEREISDYLAQARERYGFEYLINEYNLGFVGTVNKAMAMSEENDVLLLNSDTEVSGDWLDRIADQAYADDEVATVTPLSNNATICSYPDFSGRRKLQPGIGLVELNDACWAVNAGRSVEVPTGVGFCMYIKRKCLDTLGLFDAEAFGKGYGEENDFCMRAAEHGWRNILALDTFVFHAGEVSFASDSAVGKQRGMEALLAKHPQYLLKVASHIAQDPGRAYRAAITCQLWRASDKPVVLLVTHNLGGGTERHVIEIAERYARDSHVLIMRPSGTSATYGVSLQAMGDYAPFNIDIDVSGEGAFELLLRALPVTRVHIHHLLGYTKEFQQTIGRLGIPFDFTLHDYYTICPQINLTTDGVHYCSEPDQAGCNACIRSKPVHGARDIASWRLACEWVLKDAEKVFVPSMDAGKRARRYAPDANIVATYHEATEASWKQAAPRRSLDQQDKLRIAVIGVLAPHKGRQLVLDAATAAVAQNLPLEFVVIGDAFGGLPPPSVAAIRSTGRYREEELAALLASEQPDLILFASQWPETYSYTLTAALKAGLPVMAPNLGAFPERLSGRAWTFTFDWKANGTELARQLAELREQCFVEGLMPARSAFEVADVAAGPGQKSAEDVAPVPLTARKACKILAVLEYEGDVPSPCAHIRLVPFLSAMQSAGLASVRFVRAAEVDRHSADIIITHRVSVKTEYEANALLQSAQRRSIPLIYDLDDNLFELDPGAEGGRYRPLIGVVRAFVRGADEIWASTATLATYLRERAAGNVVVHRNQLDPAIWRDVLSRPVVPAARGNPVRVLCMGTRTHARDFEIVEPVLRALKEKFGDSVQICVVGVRATDDDSGGWMESLPPPPFVGASYPAFVSWLGTLPPFDIGLSPLRMNDFNRCKSEIKFLDYAALGLAPMVSDLEPYRDLVQTGVNGYLVEEHYESWLAVASRLISDHDQRLQVARAARSLDFPGAFHRGVQERWESIEARVKP